MLARWYGASITALHVCNSVEASPDSRQQLLEPEAARLKAEVRACCGAVIRAGVPFHVIVDARQPRHCILDRAAMLPADLIVMGTHGASGLEHLVLGSVTLKVLRQAFCAVLTVPPQTNRTSTLPFKRVLCAVDFSDWSLRALELARSLARESGAALTAVTAIEWPWPEPPPPTFEELPHARADVLREYPRCVETGSTRHLAALADESASAGVSLAVRVAHGKSHVEILRCAADIGADLIVIVVHRRKGLDLQVFGSTTNHVVRRATCPVLTLRSPTQPVS